MKICYCAAREPRPDAFRVGLEALDHELIEGENVAVGAHGCGICLLVLPHSLDEAVVMIRQQRQVLGMELPFLACGCWVDVASISRLLAAGADDYVYINVETRLLDLRLHIFAQQNARRSTTAQRERVEQRLVRAQRLETVASLTGSIAHEYNNLLSAIQGNVELSLLDLTLEGAVRHSLEQINSAAQRAAELTRQILAFRGEGAEPKINQPLHLSKLIREMGELLQVAVFRTCKIEYDLGSALPRVAGDPIRVRQLAMILTANASRALGRKGGLIQIRTGPNEGAAASQVVLEVRYSGAGVRPDAHGASVGSDDSESGLAAARLIARDHGAEFAWIADGAGGTHRIVFPASGGQTPEQESEAIGGESGRSAGTILLIDDEEAVRVASCRLLRRAGYTVFEAASSEEGLAVVGQIAAALDVVLVDLNMPGLQCRDLLLRLRQMRPDLRLVVWSGFPEHTARERLADLPNVAFMEKPTQLGELVGSIERVLRP